MNPLWLFLIVPSSMFFGFVFAALCAGAKCFDCKESLRYREDAVKQLAKDAYVAGYKAGEEGLLTDFEKHMFEKHMRDKSNAGSC